MGMRSECDTKKTSSSSTPSSLANAKTSFLQSIITSPGASNGLERNNSEAFMQEKNSVITQQKNIINDDPTPPPVTNMARGHSMQFLKGSKHQTLQSQQIVTRYQAVIIWLRRWCTTSTE